MIRGTILKVDFGEPVGSEVEGERFAIVVSNTSLNLRVHTVVVVPTSASNYKRQVEQKANVAIRSSKDPVFPRDCVAQTHLIRHVDRQRIKEVLGEISEDVMDDISVTLSDTLDVRATY